MTVSIPLKSFSRPRRTLRLFAALCAAVVAAFGLSALALEAGTSPASAATVSFSQCNGHESGPPGGAALSVNCTVSIINTIDANGGTSSVAYTRACTLNGCTGDSTSSTDVINAVHQCNGSDNAGGSATTCSVNIVNNISANAPAAPTALTLNQCIGSGATSNIVGCLPTQQGSPSVTQCNGSGNGGGALLVCSASGTTSTAFPVTVDQCNGSENGGGSTLTCTTTITTNVFDTAAPPTTPTTPPTGTPGSGTGTPGTPTGTPGSGTPGTGTGTPTGTPGSGTPGTGTPVGTPGSGTPGTGTPTAPPASPPVVVPPGFTG